MSAFSGSDLSGWSNGDSYTRKVEKALDAIHDIIDQSVLIHLRVRIELIGVVDRVREALHALFGEVMEVVHTRQLTGIFEPYDILRPACARKDTVELVFWDHTEAIDTARLNRPDIPSRFNSAINRYEAFREPRDDKLCALWAGAVKRFSDAITDGLDTLVSKPVDLEKTYGSTAWGSAGADPFAFNIPTTLQHFRQDVNRLLVLGRGLVTMVERSELTGAVYEYPDRQYLERRSDLPEAYRGSRQNLPDADALIDMLTVLADMADRMVARIAGMPDERWLRYVLEGPITDVMDRFDRADTE